jgi:phospholipase/carboxylesterase
MHQKNIVYAGKKLKDAKKALILVHGRGGSTEDILSLVPYLNIRDYAVLAPQATENSWYPYSFLFPPSQNEPWLSSALGLLNEIVFEIENNGIFKDRIYFSGFSQGACLSLEFIARNATRFGGMAAFSGGLIGDKIYTKNYKGNCNQTPVFLGSSDPDPHIPVDRVVATSDVLREMNANVSIKIYPAMGHTISQDEIERVNEMVFVEK